MSAQLDPTLLPALNAIERALERKPKPVVTTQRNPLDYCDGCGARDVYGEFSTGYRNGKPVALCDRCN